MWEGDTEISWITAATGTEKCAWAVSEAVDMLTMSFWPVTLIKMFVVTTEKSAVSGDDKIGKRRLLENTKLRLPADLKIFGAAMNHMNCAVILFKFLIL